MAFWKKLFGGGEAPPVEPEMHEGFAIYAEPINEGSRWRLAARIEKDVAGALKTHQLIRADTFEDRETAERESAAKARQVIAEQGDRLFG